VGLYNDERPATRVVDEPRRSPLPYFAAAIIAAVACWSFLQPQIDRLQDFGGKRPLTQSPREETIPDGAKGDLRTLFSADDYPADAQSRGEQGTVLARLSIDSRGAVNRCEIARSSGSSSLDEATCRILKRRARFTPARDSSGNSVSDTVTTPPIVWRLEG
jgi:TonB family protein